MPVTVLALFTPDVWPFAILVTAVAFVIVAISWLRMHAFLALILAAILAGVMATSLPVNPSRSGAEADHRRVRRDRCRHRHRHRHGHHHRHGADGKRRGR
jgi:hypothetical protein